MSGRPIQPNAAPQLDEGMILCPRCRNDSYLHLRKAEIAQSDYDNDDLDVRLTFECELHEPKTPVVLLVRQHKGATVMEWVDA